MTRSEAALGERHAAFLQLIEELHARHLVGVPGVREVWLIRHADAYVGLEALDPGVIDPPLSQVGLEQAQRLGERLARVALDQVWSSDLQRARETATAVARHHALTVRTDARLREVRTEWDEGGMARLEETGVYPFPEPETQVVARMGSAIANISAEAPRRAAVVSHNAAIGVYLSSLLGLKWGELRVFPQFTSVTVLAIKEGTVLVRSIADATHLAESLD